ncbi:hypothetical protein [Rhodococcus sp. PvP104]|uniref:hypothetical protein n=1 Tax=Rhodococcus sp. PvP104 TaxID=2817911 RepID=UPI001AEA2429|nr:hypothetical protein [Rhodococcus sp. PvP104]MBP2522292.1 hypothetical protein [Rhodococcus sp. PvP104]
MIFPGSAREMVAFPPAPMFVVPIDAAASGAGTATAVLVTTPVYPMNVVGDGTAGVTVSGVAVFMAAVSGVGEALAVFAQLIEAPVSGVGTASVVVKPSISLAASVSSTGTPAVVVKPVAPIIAAVTCEGIAGVGAWPAATMTAPVSGSGTAIAAATARSVIAASVSGSGTAEAAVTVNMFIQQSVTKNGDQQLAASAWTEVGPWTAGSNTTVTGNALRVNGSGNATIQVGSEWPTSTSVKDWRVLKNGSVVWTKGSGTGLTLADTFALAVVDGDLLTCEAWNSSGVAGNRIVKTGANTYLRVVPA